MAGLANTLEREGMLNRTEAGRRHPQRKPGGLIRYP